MFNALTPPKSNEFNMKKSKINLVIMIPKVCNLIFSFEAILGLELSIVAANVLSSSILMNLPHLVH